MILSLFLLAKNYFQLQASVTTLLDSIPMVLSTKRIIRRLESIEIHYVSLVASYFAFFPLSSLDRIMYTNAVRFLGIAFILIGVNAQTYTACDPTDGRGIFLL